MKNQNKCFFSISLENGITITGANPNEVINFLTTLESDLYWAAVHYAEHDLPVLQEGTEKILDSVSNAALNICNLISEEEG